MHGTVSFIPLKNFFLLSAYLNKESNLQETLVILGKIP